MADIKHTPGLDLREGLTDKQLNMHPVCPDCGWRQGGIDSWDGTRCKCRKSAPSFRTLLAAADDHETKADALDTLDCGDGDCEPAASFHATRASQLRAFVAKAAGGQHG